MPEAGFASLDWAVFVFYLVVVVVLGASFSKRQKSTAEYFTAGKRMHWLPISLSVVASIFSGISFIGHPARVYRAPCSVGPMG